MLLQGTSIIASSNPEPVVPIHPQHQSTIVPYNHVMPEPPKQTGNRNPEIYVPTTTTAPPVITIVDTTTTTLHQPPPGYTFGSFNQICPQVATSAGNQCQSTTDIASDVGGRLICDKNAECCMCSSIQCGFGSTKCKEVRFGDQAAFGVGEIEVAGHVNGGIVHCNGIKSCQMATITGNNIIAVDCDGNHACQFATIIITDPTEYFVLDCGGIASCDGLRIELIFSGPPPAFECKHIADPTVPKTVFEIAGIECGNDSACNLAEIIINNEFGCDTVNVGMIECNHHNACNGAAFNLIGDVKLEHCQCGPSGSCNTATGLDTCYMSLPVV